MHLKLNVACETTMHESWKDNMLVMPALVRSWIDVALVCQKPSS